MNRATRRSPLAVLAPAFCLVLGLEGPSALAQTYLTERPIRGAWMRPPGSLDDLELRLRLMHEAGLRDLFLETFYHGLSTGRQGVFNARFSFDYLAEAIRLGARYNIRVHAWVESGYWQYQQTGAYNFVGFEGWKVVNTATGVSGGDQDGQIFANLAHPGVQAKLRSYCAELADYPGLWGIQTDYHRYPLDNNTGDSYPAPWSYDVWSRTTFRDLFGVNIDTAARTPAGSHWTQFLQWRRDGISEAANQMHQGINGVNPGVTFSAAVFATAMTSSAQLTKCQDWPRWARDGYIDVVVPMAYGGSTSSINSDVQATINQASGRRVVPGLVANSSVSITSQLNIVDNYGIFEFIWWEAQAIIDSARRAELAAWIAANSPKQRADFNDDGYVDQRDRDLFDSFFDGTTLPASSQRRRYNFDGDLDIDNADYNAFLGFYRRFHFGDDGVIDSRDIAAFNQQFTGPGPGIPGPYLNLYDLDGDGDVDQDDRAIMYELGGIVPCPADFNGDGFVDFFDLDDYVAAFEAGSPASDFNGDGFVDFFDLDDYVAAFEAGC